ncbi:penicillin-binding protein activator [Pseudomonas sp. RIT-PI-S]|uniref:penicillin-binding protein activator n=1 Tax=Pseudomonas sp. RIT-PI-S TaxID=3035295 RepID=UPI0021DA57A4|nr:penicillin-binding protein activator [Pseudomonas sp. RIT-PI-S]
MTGCLRPLIALIMAALLAACASQSASTLGELPRTANASVDQLLQQAAASQSPEEAALLRLGAADKALQEHQDARATQIFGDIDLSRLRPAQQVFASTLLAELALNRNDPKAALTALGHPSLEHLGELPMDQQIRTQTVRARALEADGQTLAAARERILLAPMLQGEASKANHEQIWALISSLPANQVQPAGNDDLAGWLSLAQVVKTPSTLEQQKAAIEAWRGQHATHPAARELPAPLQQLMAITNQPVEHIALLLPQQGPLAGVARALRDGFMAAYYQASQTGQATPSIEVYDSSRVTSMDDFYRQAQAAGIQLVVGPLEKNLVKQLSSRPQLPITTLALNYSDSTQPGPAQLFQFGLAAEDEAHEVARRARADGLHRAAAIVPKGEFGDRVLAAFRQDWQAGGGTVVAAVQIDQPVALAQQIADLMQVRQTGTGGQATRRQDVDFIYLTATPQQAQQVKPTLNYQYAGEVPVYATSHVYSASGDQAQYADLNGVRFCETPWLLDADNALRQQVAKQWPQANGSLGRLYAMGADAYTLAPQLGQLKALPDNRVEGLSGSLSLNSAQRIERQLPWAQFNNGKVERLPAGAQ